MSVFLTDDGCTDGTSDAIRYTFTGRSIHIIPSGGNAYWAGGMRIAWNSALEYDRDVDGFILINDDTVFKNDCIASLLEAHIYAQNKYGVGGVYSGFISEHANEDKILYGAKKYENSFFSKSVDLQPTGIPQECEMVNANFLMVASNVVREIGILDKEFIHAAADLDYGIRARRAGFPVLTTAGVCGYTEYDHDSGEEEAIKVKAMTLRERRAYLMRPTIKQYHDSLVFFRRYAPVKAFLFGGSFYLNLYFPTIYYWLYKKRGH